MERFRYDRSQVATQKVFARTLAGITSVGIVAALVSLSALGGEGDELASGEQSNPRASEAEASVICQGNATFVTGPVRAASDGVHLIVENRTGTRTLLTVEGLGGGGTHAPPGLGEVDAPATSGAWQIPPGTVQVGCGHPTDDQAMFVDLVVEDPMGLWRPHEVECEPTVSLARVYHAGPGQLGRPADIARAKLDEFIQQGDAFEPAGYPDSPHPIFRLVRDSAIVAYVQLIPAPHAGWWYVEAWEQCL